MGEVAEAECGPAEVLEPPVDRFRRPVRRAGSVEERDDVGGALFHRAAELADRDQRGGDPAADRGDHGLHHLLGLLLVRFPVGRDDALVDAPGRFDLDVLLAREHGLQSRPLTVGEQARAGVESAAGLVERIVLQPAVPGGVLLDPASADIERVTGETDDMEWVHDRCRVREFLSGDGLEPGEPVHRDHLDPLAPRGRPRLQPLLEHRLRTPLDHVQQPRRPPLLAGGGEVDDHGDVLVAEAGVTPDVLVHAERVDPVEPVRVVDQPTLALGEHCGVRGAPGHPEARGDAGHREVIDHDAP